MTGRDESAHARYARQVLLPEIATRGQEALADAAVLVVGAGGLGSPVIADLSGAGVGRIGIIDDDVVELSNLHRQVIHTTDETGRSKAASAAERARAINPQVEVTEHAIRLDARNAGDLLGHYDIVVDCTDNFPARYLVSDTCALLAVPDVWAAVSGFDGAVSVFRRGSGPCYRCLHPRPPQPGSVRVGADAGVLGPLPGVVGAMQAVETIKLITGAGRPLIGRVALYDALGGGWRELTVTANPVCPACGHQAERAHATPLPEQTAPAPGTGPSGAQAKPHAPGTGRPAEAEKP